LNSAQLPNGIESIIQIITTLLSVMGSITKMNFERNKNLEAKNLD
jgi:hypothetical protein